MLTILGAKVSIETVGFFVLFITSEVIGNSKLKSNGLVQLLASLVNGLKPLRKEDEQIDAIRRIIGGR
jgi:hypothetical protein